MKRWTCRSFVAAALLCGVALRWALNSHVSGDARVYLLPWYGFVRTHGLGALRVPFTNYTPYYTYLLLGLTRLEGMASPLTLIKAVSAIFELGCAVMVARIVCLTGGGRWARALSFAGVWLAPTVLLNGPYWAQADSLWTFFILVSLMLFMEGRNGIPSFALAFAVKFQSMFFGPFMLGMILKRRALWRRRSGGLCHCGAARAAGRPPSWKRADHLPGPGEHIPPAQPQRRQSLDLRTCRRDLRDGFGIATGRVRRALSSGGDRADVAG
jgi:Gpi18-like mannosyltransferase